jgi:hypothetical protein
MWFLSLPFDSSLDRYFKRYGGEVDQNVRIGYAAFFVVVVLP